MTKQEQSLIFIKHTYGVDFGSQLLSMGVGSKLQNKLCTTTKNKWELSFLHAEVSFICRTHVGH